MIIIFRILTPVGDLRAKMTCKTLYKPRFVSLVRLEYRGQLIEYHIRALRHDYRKEDGRSAVQVERLKIYGVEQRADNEKKNGEYNCFHVIYVT